jgi:hypothetical protein
LLSICQLICNCEIPPLSQFKTATKENLTTDTTTDTASDHTPGADDVDGTAIIVIVIVVFPLSVSF